jgi:hypothetical protein
MVPRTNIGRSDPKGFGKVAIAAGIIAFIVAICWFLHSCYLVVGSFQAPGQITQLIDEPKHQQDVYFPVYTYTDQDGKEHTVHSHTGSNGWLSYHVGDRVTVLYSPNDADNPWLDDWMTLWGVPLILIAAGIVFVPIGILSIRSA